MYILWIVTIVNKVRKSTGGNFDVLKDTVAMPFKCKRCGGCFCAKHRLPENHVCPGLKTPITIDFDIELENIIESGHNEKIESHIQSKISQSQESEYITCDVCSNKKNSQTYNSKNNWRECQFFT